MSRKIFGVLFCFCLVICQANDNMSNDTGHDSVIGGIISENKHPPAVTNSENNEQKQQQHQSQAPNTNITENVPDQDQQTVMATGGSEKVPKPDQHTSTVMDKLENAPDQNQQTVMATGGSEKDADQNQQMVSSVTGVDENGSDQNQETAPNTNITENAPDQKQQMVSSVTGVDENVSDQNQETAPNTNITENVSDQNQQTVMVTGGSEKVPKPDQHTFTVTDKLENVLDQDQPQATDANRSENVMNQEQQTVMDADIAKSVLEQTVPQVTSESDKVLEQTQQTVPQTTGVTKKNNGTQMPSVMAVIESATVSDQNQQTATDADKPENVKDQTVPVPQVTSESDKVLKHKQQTVPQTTSGAEKVTVQDPQTVTNTDKPANILQPVPAADGSGKVLVQIQQQTGTVKKEPENVQGETTSKQPSGLTSTLGRTSSEYQEVYEISEQKSNSIQSMECKAMNFLTVMSFICLDILVVWIFLIVWKNQKIMLGVSQELQEHRRRGENQAAFECKAVQIEQSIDTKLKISEANILRKIDKDCKKEIGEATRKPAITPSVVVPQAKEISSPVASSKVSQEIQPPRPIPASNGQIPVPESPVNYVTEPVRDTRGSVTPVAAPNTVSTNTREPLPVPECPRHPSPTANPMSPSSTVDDIVPGYLKDILPAPLKNMLTNQMQTSLEIRLLANDLSRLKFVEQNRGEKLAADNQSIWMFLKTTGRDLQLVLAKLGMKPDESRRAMSDIATAIIGNNRFSCQLNVPNIGDNVTNQHEVFGGNTTTYTVREVLNWGIIDERGNYQVKPVVK